MLLHRSIRIHWLNNSGRLSRLAPIHRTLSAIASLLIDFAHFSHRRFIRIVPSRHLDHSLIRLAILRPSQRRFLIVLHIHRHHSGPNSLLLHFPLRRQLQLLQLLLLLFQLLLFLRFSILQCHKHPLLLSQLLIHLLSHRLALLLLMASRHNHQHDQHHNAHQQHRQQHDQHDPPRAQRLLRAHARFAQPRRAVPVDFALLAHRALRQTHAAAVHVALLLVLLSVVARVRVRFRGGQLDHLLQLHALVRKPAGIQLLAQLAQHGRVVQRLLHRRRLRLGHVQHARGPHGRFVGQAARRAGGLLPALHTRVVARQTELCGQRGEQRELAFLDFELAFDGFVGGNPQLRVHEAIPFRGDRRLQSLRGAVGAVEALLARTSERIGLADAVAAAFMRSAGLRLQQSGTRRLADRSIEALRALARRAVATFALPAAHQRAVARTLQPVHHDLHLRAPDRPAHHRVRLLRAAVRVERAVHRDALQQQLGLHASGHFDPRRVRRGLQCRAGTRRQRGGQRHAGHVRRVRVLHGQLRVERRHGPQGRA